MKLRSVHFEGPIASTRPDHLPLEIASIIGFEPAIWFTDQSYPGNPYARRRTRIIPRCALLDTFDQTWAGNEFNIVIRPVVVTINLECRPCRRYIDALIDCGSRHFVNLSDNNILTVISRLFFLNIGCRRKTNHQFWIMEDLPVESLRDFRIVR